MAALFGKDCSVGFHKLWDLLTSQRVGQQAPSEGTISSESAVGHQADEAADLEHKPY